MSPSQDTPLLLVLRVCDQDTQYNMHATTTSGVCCCGTSDGRYVLLLHRCIASSRCRYPPQVCGSVVVYLSISVSEYPLIHLVLVYYTACMYYITDGTLLLVVWYTACMYYITDGTLLLVVWYVCTTHP